MNINIAGLSFLESCAEGWIGLKVKTKAHSMLEAVLMRQLPKDNPDVSLMCAVIAQAASDSVMDVRKAEVKEQWQQVRDKQDGIAFFIDGRSEAICDLIGLDHEFLLDMYWRMLAVDDPRAIC